MFVFTWYVRNRMGHFPTKYEIKLDIYVKIGIYVYVSCKNYLQNYLLTTAYML